MESGTTPIALLSTISSASSLHQQNVKDGPSSTTSGIPKLMEQMSVGDLSMSLQHFGWADYFVFILMLAVCAAIGVYFGFMEKSNGKDGKGGKRKVEQRRGSEALDYLVGGRKMKVFPVSMSLVASFVSGISLLGTSTEIYVYGTQYAFILITIAFSGVVSWYIFLPVFCNLQLTSTYEYLELRFDSRVRLFGSVLFITSAVLWLPIAVYVPALTFNQVTGVNVHVISMMVCSVCTFYTCVGGLKAVVWTDVIQSFVMYGSIFLVMIKGTMDLGGIGVVLQRNWDSGRLEAPEMTLDPTVRMSVLAIFVGGTFMKIQHIAVNQPAVQRFISLPTMAHAKQTLIIFVIGLILLLLSCSYVGLLTYATYYDCDPLKTKLAKATDQLVPLMVMHILGMFPGLPGLFVSGVCSAALSSVSTCLNSLSAVILEDFIKPYWKSDLTEKQTAITMRFIVLFFGFSCAGLIFVVEKLGMVLQLSLTLHGITQGPLLAVFFIGMCLPWIKTKSALVGGICGFIFMGYVCVRAQTAIASGDIVFAKKPVSVEGCTYDFTPVNTTTIPNLIETSKSLHHISFLWYTALGTSVTITVAALCTIIFGTNDTSEMDHSVVAPFIRRFMKTRKYDSVTMNEKIPNELTK